MLSVATSIKENQCNSRPNLFLEFQHIVNKLQNNKILIAWIPSHIGLAGNGIADILAKQSLELPEITLRTSFIVAVEPLDRDDEQTKET